MKRGKFSLSNFNHASMDMGILVPIGWFETLPGDTIQHSTSALVRAAPLVSPVMHPVSVRIHHWFVPHRLVWNNWEPFITGGPDGMDISQFPIQSTDAGATVGSLYDYMGIPLGIAGLNFSALPMRAYQLIWNEWYRDQDLQTPAVINKGDGNDATTAKVLQKINWEKDYFTSSRPWEQKGPAVTLPLGTTAPVVRSGATINVRGGDGVDRTLNALSAGGTVFTGTNPATNQLLTFGNPTGLQADLSTATAATVNQIRQAMAIQRIEEARARYGSRYVEYLRSAFGVKSSDARLQKPEYLGGGRQTVQFSEVLQTGPSASVDQANVVGALKGHGIGAMRSNRYRRFFEEHGIVLSVMSIRPKTVYQDGLARKFNRRVKEEFFQPELAHIGQQAVKNKEIYAAHASPEATFGYQDRYDEYRRQESIVAGEFRTILNYWHMSRIFGSAPALNSSFVECVPPLRTFASSTTDPFYVYCNHSIQARRCVPASGTSFVF